ncbi:PPK2 family polyphosphate:nucleotide phosphotransferase [Antricoccus suffuscus]|uniref:PPK2 family polyphosphate:nucleotide phosphotransferase n=1 Tax=Antricoccus suffuscus TaxID=1629062 RepID=A0A2T1A540_9ACTN|nr:PPK2 family polyphosphate kinase [Antricoccus suffuscus]PRZ43706.1 PPK2 family polyphosphate:nucleotide phosphotransferase [Antricoccus suffuscus]
MGKKKVKDNFSLSAALRVPTDGDAEAVREHLQQVHSRATPYAPGNKHETVERMQGRGPELTELQERFFAMAAVGGNKKILVVLQGMDTSGKGGVIEHVMGLVNPNGLQQHSFKSPTKEELEHDFLWRVRKVLPIAGKIGIFDRSHYEDVLIVRVHDLVAADEWSQRYDQINDFEQELVDDDTIVVKCFLNVSYDEQRERLLARLDDPTKHWKFNEGDVKERGYWADYQVAYLEALTKCSTDAAPWYSIPADRKWYRNWAVSRLLLETLRDIDPQYPKTDLDIPTLKKQLMPPN